MINSKLTRRRRAYNWWLRHNSAVFYWIALIILTGYVLINWDTCISMQFFQHFDGNNILFFCWLLMIFLKIFRIKVKDIEVFRDLQNDIMVADMQHIINEREQKIAHEYFPIERCDKGGKSINDQSSN